MSEEKGADVAQTLVHPPDLKESNTSSQDVPDFQLGQMVTVTPTDSDNKRVLRRIDYWYTSQDGGRNISF